MDASLANRFTRHTGVGIDILQKQNWAKLLMYYAFYHSNTCISRHVHTVISVSHQGNISHFMYCNIELKLKK